MLNPEIHPVVKFLFLYSTQDCKTQVERKEKK